MSTPWIMTGFFKKSIITSVHDHYETVNTVLFGEMEMLQNLQ